MIWQLTQCAKSSGDSFRAPKTHYVEIRHMKFIPDTLKIVPGDSVTWVNKDLVSHNVAQKQEKSWISDKLNPGDSFSLKINTNTDYYCTLHSIMDGTIIINN
jgi:plastocyanin